MTADAIETLLNVRGVAQLLAVSTRQVWRLHAQGLLPEPVRIGGSVRWRREDLAAWLNARCPASQADGRKEGQVQCT